MLSQDQKTMLVNIIKMIEISREKQKENKEVSLLKNFLIKNFNTEEEKISKIIKILEIDQKVEFKIEKDSSEYFMTKGFLLKLKELGFNFPTKKDKEIVFDIDTKLDIDYLLNTSKSILKKDEKDQELDLIKKQIEIHGFNSEIISTTLNLDKEKLEKTLNKIERAINMRAHNSKVKQNNDQN